MKIIYQVSTETVAAGKSATVLHPALRVSMNGINSCPYLYIFVYRYVSCSECSYDSEECTCSSADRCYCSLRSNKPHNKVRRKSNHRTVSKRSKRSNTTAVVHSSSHNKANNSNRLSYISCNSDEKCYCSMTEEQDTEPKVDESDKAKNNNDSNTSWCDTDSCKSTSKCYCKNMDRDVLASQPPSSGQETKKSPRSMRKPTNKLALDYELFNIDTNNSRNVQPYEALSVKKSVEAAAIFADFKLSQTTDIKSLCTRREEASLEKMQNTYHSYSVATRKSSRSKHLIGNNSTFSNCKGTSISIASKNTPKISYTTEDFFNTLKNIERSVKLTTPAGNTVNNLNTENGCCEDKQKQMQQKYASTSSPLENKGCTTNYQSMRAVNHTLEDALGYLP